MNKTLHISETEVLSEVYNSLFFVGTSGKRIYSTLSIFQKLIEDLPWDEEIKIIIRNKENLNSIRDLLNTNCLAFNRISDNGGNKAVCKIRKAIKEYILKACGREATIINDEPAIKKTINSNNSVAEEAAISNDSVIDETTINHESVIDLIHNSYLFRGKYVGRLINGNYKLISTPIAKLNWTVRFRNTIKRKHEINSLQDLLNTDYEELLKIRNFGKGTYEQVKKIIIEFIQSDHFKNSIGSDENNILVESNDLIDRGEANSTIKYPLLYNYPIQAEFPKSFLASPISSFDFPIRFINYAGKKGKIKILVDLLRLCPDDLIKEKNLGKKTIKLIIQEIQYRSHKYLSETEINDLNNFAKTIDGYFDDLPERGIETARLKWVELKSLEEIGEKFNLTRERVRQILQKFINNTANHFAENLNLWRKQLLDLLLIKPEPITEALLITDGYKPHYHPNFYLGLISELIPEALIQGFIPKSLEQTINRRIISDRQWEKLSKTLDELEIIHEQITTHKLSSILSEKGVDISQQLLCFKIIYGQKKYFFFGENGKYFLFRKGGIRDVTYRILKGSAEPLTGDELVSVIKKYYDVGTKYTSLNSVMGNIKQDERILQLNKYLFGVEDHLAYPREEWSSINSQAKTFLKGIKRQYYITEILDDLKKNYPKLKSKYELVHILRADEEINDLGFFNFSLSSCGQEERIKVCDMIKKIFNNNPTIKHVNDIKNELRKNRFIADEGMSALLKNQKYLKNYPGGFYGLMNLDKENENELVEKEQFLKNIVNQHYPFTHIETIAEYFDCEKKKQRIISNILNSNSFQVYTLDSGISCVINKSWSTFKKIKCLLANHDEEVYEEQLFWMLKDLGAENYERDLYRIRHDGEITYKNNKYLLLRIDSISDDLNLLLDQCYDFISDSAKSYIVQELFELVKAEKNDIEFNQFIFALKEDERFIVTESNLVLIK